MRYRSLFCCFNLLYKDFIHVVINTVNVFPKCFFNSVRISVFPKNKTEFLSMKAILFYYVLLERLTSIKPCIVFNGGFTLVKRKQRFWQVTSIIVFLCNKEAFRFFEFFLFIFYTGILFNFCQVSFTKKGTFFFILTLDKFLLLLGYVDFLLYFKIDLVQVPVYIKIEFNFIPANTIFFFNYLFSNFQILCNTRLTLFF